MDTNTLIIFCLLLPGEWVENEIFPFLLINSWKKEEEVTSATTKNHKNFSLSDPFAWIFFFRKKKLLNKRIIHEIQWIRRQLFKQKMAFQLICISTRI